MMAYGMGSGEAQWFWEEIDEAGGIQGQRSHHILRRMANRRWTICLTKIQYVEICTVIHISNYRCFYFLITRWHHFVRFCLRVVIRVSSMQRAIFRMLSERPNATRSSKSRAKMRSKFNKIDMWESCLGWNFWDSTTMTNLWSLFKPPALSIDLGSL